MAKHLPLLLLAIITFCGCKKDKTVYQSFSEKELDFVNYADGQDLKIIDSSGSIFLLQQLHYKREFERFGGSFLFGQKGAKTREKYEVGYASVNMLYFFDMQLNLRAAYTPYSLGQLALTINRYSTYTDINSQESSVDNLTVNTISYRNVYRLKVYKDGIVINNTDTATIYWNKDIGFIQLLFPNGKSFTRTN